MQKIQSIHNICPDSLVNGTQGGHSGRTSSIWYETHIDIFEGDDEGDVGRFDDCWRSLTLTLNLANGICRKINVIERKPELEGGWRTIRSAINYTIHSE